MGSNRPTKIEYDPNNLYIKGLSLDCTQIELDDLFREFGPIHRSRVHGDGIGFVRFENPIYARKAIETLNGKKPGKCKQNLIVKFAQKKNQSPKGVMRNDKDEQFELVVHQNSRNVYIRGLPLNCNEGVIREVCVHYGEVTCIRFCKNGSAFVRYQKDVDAKNAIQNLNGKYLLNSNQPLLVKLANSDPFEPRIECRSECTNKAPATENSTIQPATPLCNNSNSNNTTNYSNCIQYYNPIQSFYNSTEYLEQQTPKSNIGYCASLNDYNILYNNVYPSNLYIPQQPNNCDYNSVLNVIKSANATVPMYPYAPKPATAATPLINLNNDNSNTSFIMTGNCSSTSPLLETSPLKLSCSNTYSNVTQNTSSSNLQCSPRNISSSMYSIPSLHQNSLSLERTLSNVSNMNNRFNNLAYNNISSNNLCTPNTSINSTTSMDTCNLSLIKNNNYTTSNNNYTTPSNNCYSILGVIATPNITSNNTSEIINTIPTLEISTQSNSLNILVPSTSNGLLTNNNSNNQINK